MSKINHTKKIILSPLTKRIENEKLLTELQRRIKVLEAVENYLDLLMSRVEEQYIIEENFKKQMRGNHVGLCLGTSR
jgi:trans-aconitate methyltransferase